MKDGGIRHGLKGRLGTAKEAKTSGNKASYVYKQIKLFAMAVLLSIPFLWNYSIVSEILRSSEQEAVLGTEHAFLDSQTTSRSSLLIVTAFSENHMLESVKMMKSLISQNYTGKLAIYLLKQTNERFSEKLAHSLPKLIRRSPLNVISIQHMDISDEFETYCFKSHVIHDVLEKHNPDIVMWADTSVVFKKDPQLIADEMDQSGVELYITEGTMGMGHNTYNETAAWFGLDRRTFHEKREIQSGLWFAHVKNRFDGTQTSVFQEIVEPFIDCGMHHCKVCMAPGENLKSVKIGKKRIEERGESYEGVHPPGAQFIAHRQDQSVLSLLVHKFIASHPRNPPIIKIVGGFNNGYMYAERGTKGIQKIQDLLG